jgi:hypothetical protein
MRVKCLPILLLAVLAAATLPSSGVAQMMPVFGPNQYTRAAGPPQTFTETFEHCGTAECQLVVINGNADGINRISSASISLNGVEIVGRRDFNQQVATIVKPVELAELNELTIRLTSKPGGFLIVSVQCLASPVDLLAGGPGVTLLDTTLLSALPIFNIGTAAAENVQLTTITLDEGTLTLPTSLPFGLGTIPVGSSAILDTNFVDAFAPLESYILEAQGTYEAGVATYCFSIISELMVPPAAPGSRDLDMVTVDPFQVSGAPYPSQPRDPASLDFVNGSRWTVPIGPFVAGTPTETATGAETASPGFTRRKRARHPLGNGPGPIVFLANNPLGMTSGPFNGTASTVAEPSGSSNAEGVIFATANWVAAVSTDGGSNFTQLDPTTVFPNDAVGFCCDQIVQYVPSIDRFIWLLQGNGYRLATASPQDIIDSGGTAWTYWNLTPQVFGQPNGTGFDYPDLSVGDDFLYMSWDAGFGCPSGCRQGFQVARTSLAGLQAGGTITIGFTDPPDGPMALGSHLVQNTLDEIFWAGHNSNSQMRVFSLQEDSNTYFWRDRGVSSWARVALSSTTPDGQNWLGGSNGFPGTAIIGGTRSGNQVWFAWNAGTDDNFQQPHVEMVTLDRANDFSTIQQVQIWNDAYAFAYPALSTNFCTGEVGLSLEWGGGGNYENHVVGFWGDFVVYVTTASNVGTTRFGDYVTLRQRPLTGAHPGNLFIAFGYGLTSGSPPGPSTLTDIRHVVFGRPASSCIIIN